MYFELEPEVAGGFGQHTIFGDRKARPPRLERFHYEIDGWMGDSLLEAVGCFVIAEDAAAALRGEGLTGFDLGPVEVTASDDFQERYPGKNLPEFHWLKITGIPGRDDFGLSSACRLVVSQRALEVLKERGTFTCGTYEPLSS